MVAVMDIEHRLCRLKTDTKKYEFNNQFIPNWTLAPRPYPLEYLLRQLAFFACPSGGGCPKHREIVPVWRARYDSLVPQGFPSPIQSTQGAIDKNMDRAQSVLVHRNIRP
jgi:hypothetical protein